MLRSMFTAISSLLLHQNYMDVVADNLANTNTTGFKASRYTFLDQFTQVISAGTPPTDTAGGVNPVQIGLGTRMGTVSALHTQGSLQSTGRNNDVAIQGDGYLIYSDGTANYYSRDGMLDMDSTGHLVHMATGMRVQGWQATDGVVDTNLPITDIQLPLGSTQALATTEASLAGNLDATWAAGDPDNPAPSATFGVYDSLGGLHSITVTYTKSTTVANTWTWAATSADGTVNITSGAGTLAFDADGQYVSGSPGNITATVTDPAGAAALDVDLVMTDMTQLSSDTDVSTLNQNGLAAGDLTSFFISQDTGEIYGLYSNGIQEVVGQLSMAKFLNPTGLVRNGENMYQEGLNSGVASVGTAGTGGRGNLVSGYLEASNVDMAQEFTNMILAQRGFQASSRVITTSDEMLQELVNLKR